MQKTKFKDLFIVKNKSHKDQRGYFKELIRENKINKKFPFTVMSYSKRNVIRGLHLQRKKSQGKFISVIKGKIFDVALDLRKNSKTFGKTYKVILSDKDCLSLYIPEGFAHAYYSFEKINLIYYKLTNYYKPQFESGINLLDRNLKLKWPKKRFNISKKDKKLISFNEFCNIYKSL